VCGRVCLRGMDRKNGWKSRKKSFVEISSHNRAYHGRDESNDIKWE
jgi:hypothetical protein